MSTLAVKPPIISPGDTIAVRCRVRRRNGIDGRCSAARRTLNALGGLSHVSPVQLVAIRRAWPS